eukprot:CAMPEP_0198152550 /NCGR_PEP_ID=MMETSP1443-20131203/60277_1 /TAXON_ID=186043 /ORGANISM="Entomoneis sp., Strain CCMP2396" /LENGTH=57 /DNA_ID=CAMNT_0043818607 /DNA_START=276 /DNA_END=446 /DNA_ORIENTATION=+
MNLIQEGPGLVVKFCIPKNFSCKHLNSDDERPGYACFTEWNESATFVPLDSPSDDAS